MERYPILDEQFLFIYFLSPFPRATKTSFVLYVYFFFVRRRVLTSCLTAHFKNPGGVDDVDELERRMNRVGIQDPLHVHQFPKPRPGGKWKEQEGYAVLRAADDVDKLVKAFGSMVSVKPPTCQRTKLTAKRNVNYVPLVGPL